MSNAHTPKAELAVVKHAKRMYDIMLKESTKEVYEGNELDVFHGSFGEVFSRLETSRSYYGPIRNLLEESGSIVYIRRAGKGRASTIVLREPLTDEALEKFQREHLTPTDPGATLRALAELELELRTLTARVDNLGKGLNVAEALVNHESRIHALEVEILGESNLT